MVNPDVGTIRRALSIFAPGADGVLELRALGVGGHPTHTASGYFDDAHLGEMAQCAAALSNSSTGVYFTLNPCRLELLARANNRVIEFVRTTTQDSEILCRRWLPLDFDPKRPSGISASREEKVLARVRCQDCVAYLTSQGWQTPIIADSGNGFHAIYRIDLPNDESSKRLIRRTLKSLSAMFSDDAVDLDITLFNAARILKLYGTIARKGDSTDERPHRASILLEVPA